MELPIEFVNYEKSDKDAVCRFYDEVYIVDEPLSGLSHDDSEHEGLDKFSGMLMDECLRSEVSIIGKHVDTKDIVAISLCNPSSAEEPNMYLLTEDYQDEEYLMEQKIFQMFADINKIVNVFEKYGVDKAVHLFAVAVSREFRGRGIGTEIIRQTLDRGRQLGFKLIYAEASSNYTRNILGRLGFENLASIDINDYFKKKLPTGEHTLLTLHARTL